MRLLRKTFANFRRIGFYKTLLKIKSHIQIRWQLRKLDALKSTQTRTKIPYDSEYQTNLDFSEYQTEIKALAFYLPQYHTIPENDKWWGKGFTEWTNTKKAKPRFEGHYQPRQPHKDIGYYDLGTEENFLNTISKQSALAKQHGIYGFCFHHYWFSGKTLLEKPVDMLLANPQVDINFCLCWANESWTRAWDGHNDEVLIKQEYREKDPAHFIDDIKKYTSDSRYIKIDGKPLIVVYNPGHIPDAISTFRQWREQAQKIGIGEILIWICRTDNNTAESLKLSKAVDAEIEFPPHNMWYNNLRITDIETFDSKSSKNANIFNYKKLVDIISKQTIQRSEHTPKPKTPLYRCAMLGWDNSARRGAGWTSYHSFSLNSFYKWMRLILNDTREKFSPEKSFVFINAWNEWAEGTYLEPDEKYGYASINTFSKALYGLPYDESNIVHLPTTHYKQPTETPLAPSTTQPQKIAIQAHIHYTDLTDELLQYISNMPLKFDCFISTDTTDKAEYIRSRFNENEIDNIGKLQIDIHENRGRDVAPFIIQLSEYIQDYDYICHIHSKKTKGSNYGDDWRKYLLNHLLGTPNTNCKMYLTDLLDLFTKDKKIGIIFPAEYPGVSGQLEWGNNEYGCTKLLKRLDIEYQLPADPIFPTGNMFWARTDAIAPMFKAKLTLKDFPKDKNQDDATVAHQIERLWIYIADSKGYSYKKIISQHIKEPLQ